MAILDPMADPSTMGILAQGQQGIDPMMAFAAHFLQNNGPSFQPHSVSSALGAGLGGAQQAMIEAQKMRMLQQQHLAQQQHMAAQNQLLQQQAAEHAAKVAAAQRQQQFYSPQNLQQFNDQTQIAPTTPNDDDGNPNPSVSGPSQFNFDKMLRAAASSGIINPEVYANHLAQREQAKAMREQTGMLRMAEIQRQIERDRQIAADNSANREIRAAAERRMEQYQRELIGLRRDTMVLAGANRQEPAPVAVVSRDGSGVELVSRRDAIGRTPAGFDPETVGAVAGAKTGAQASAKRAFNMEGIGGVIQQAEDILNGVERDESGVPKPVAKPTGSVIGRGIDIALSVPGLAVPSGVQAQRLKAVSGALVSKMPRMEGPQSDKDVVLYKEMAGQVGDPMLPVESRKAALETVKALWAKYERSQPRTNPAAPMGVERRRSSAGSPPPGAVQRIE